jgi:hypothetical protein
MYLVYSEGEPYSLKHQFLLFRASLDYLKLGGDPFQVLHCQLHRLEFDLHITAPINALYRKTVTNTACSLG